MAVISVIVGILASTTIPSMVSLMAKNSLQSSMSQVTGAIRETQRAAIKKGQSCTVNLTQTTPNKVEGSPVGCITSPVTLSSDITLSAVSISSSSPPTVTALTLPQSLIFSYKGNPNNTDELVIILRNSTKTVDQRCLAISPGIGIMRSGNYENNSCIASL